MMTFIESELFFINDCTINTIAPLELNLDPATPFSNDTLTHLHKPHPQLSMVNPACAIKPHASHDRGQSLLIFVLFWLG